MKKILFSVILVLFSISVIAQNNASLKLNLEKNKVYRLKSVSDQTITQTINGNQQTVESKVDYSLSMKMIDQTPDFMVLEVHFDTLITKTNSMGKVINMNSTLEGNIKSSETSDILSYIMNNLSKNALYVRMDFSGKPIEILNSKMLSDLVIKDTSSITLTGMMATAMKSQIVNMVSEETLKTMVGMFTWRLPAKEVSTGENWTITEQFNTGGMLLNVSNSYHLDKINGNNAEISAESNIKAADNAAPIKSGGATVTYDNLQGIGKSTLVVDARNGIVISEESKTHISGTLGISAPGVSMQMPMDISGESKIKSVE